MKWFLPSVDLLDNSGSILWLKKVTSYDHPITANKVSSALFFDGQRYWCPLLSRWMASRLCFL
jgi:hypothetical protein